MNNTSLGNAKWEAPQIVTEKYPYQPNTFWLGRAEDNTAIGYRDDRHICLVSGSRGGKGTSVIVNNLCLWPGSAVVIDPKGENATVTAARRGPGSAHCGGMGQAVHVLDPFRTAQVDEALQSRFNPFDALDPEREETIDEASRLASALVIVNDERADPFFEESARSMVRGLILHILTAPQFEGERNLLTMRSLITRGEWRLAETLRERGEENTESPQRLLWRSLENNPAFDGLVSGIGSRFGGMADNAGKTFEGVLQTANVNTEFLDSPGMRRVLSASDFQLSDLKRNPAGMTLYLSLPQRYMETHYRWLRLMISLTVSEMEIVKGQPATGLPVLMVLDEFSGLRRMNVIEKAVAQIAGFGVKLFFVLQSLEQLKATYKDGWETFLSNAGLKVFFSIEDHFTREYVSKLIGETEIVREMHSSNEGVSDTDSSTEGSSVSRGTSRNRTLGTSQNKTRGTSQNQTMGTSQSNGRSVSGGSSESRSRSQGGSRGVSYKEKPGFLFFGPSIDRESISYSDGQNWSNSESVGTQRGWSNSSTVGTSRADSRGTSFSDSAGSSQSDSQGTSETFGTSQSRTRGSSRSSTSGRSETLHKRPLLAPDDVGRLFARLDDPGNPAYPGLALVLITGAFPVIVRRANYYSDPFFIGRFDPHPDHAFAGTQGYWLGKEQIDESLVFLHESGVNPKYRWLVGEGQAVAAGMGLGSMDTDKRPAAVVAPLAGQISRLADNLTVSEAEPNLCLFVSYDRPPDNAIAVTFVELGGLCADVYVDAKDALDRKIRKATMQIVALSLLIVAAAAYLTVQDLGPARIVVLGLGIAALSSLFKRVSTLKKARQTLREKFPKWI